MSKTHAFLNGIEVGPDAVATQRALRQLELAVSELRAENAELLERIADLEARVTALE